MPGTTPDPTDQHRTPDARPLTSDPSPLGPGERYDAETGELLYSAAWLSDNQASPLGNLFHMIDAATTIAGTKPPPDEITRRRQEIRERDRARNAGRRWRR